MSYPQTTARRRFPSTRTAASASLPTGQPPFAVVACASRIGHADRDPDDVARGPVSPFVDVLVGNSILERQLFGRWPSDHSGVVAVMRLQSTS